MDFYITYFYNVRFLPRNALPLSTAIYNPKWFTPHVDARGVINGVRYSAFVPGKNCQDKCHGREGCNKEPSTCDFLQAYREQIFSLDFNKVTSHIERMAASMNVEDPIAVLLVYEKPDNPCSERTVLQEWFKANGSELKEFKV